FFFSSRRRHTRFSRDWSSDVCSSDLGIAQAHLGDVLGTAAQFNTYLRYSPGDLTAHYNRGYAFLQMGFIEWALGDFEFVLRAKQIGRASCRERVWGSVVGGAVT